MRLILLILKLYIDHSNLLLFPSAKMPVVAGPPQAGPSTFDKSECCRLPLVSLWMRLQDFAHRYANLLTVKMGAMMGSSMSTSESIFCWFLTNPPTSCRWYHGFHYRLVAIHGSLYDGPNTHGIIGTVTIFQYGAGPNGVMRTLGKFMLGSGATFGYVFL